MTSGRLLFWLLLSLALLGACTRGPHEAKQLALRDEPRLEGGIGGTGLKPGDIGVFGTVGDLGGIEVAGVRIGRADDLRPQPIDRELPASTLAPGDVVAGELERRDGGLAIRRMIRVLPLIGPVEQLDAGTGALVVLGTSVRLAPGAPPLPPVARGEWVAVSGLWSDGAVVASRVERLAGPQRASASGLLRRRDGGWQIGGTTIDVSCCGGLAQPGFAVVTGQYRSGRLIADRLTGGVDALFPRPVERLVVEGFLARNPDDPGYHLSGSGIPMDPASPIVPNVGRRAIFVGSYDRKFRIERDIPLPDSTADRRRVLDSLSQRTLLAE
jgi:hypothetical protein